MFAQTVKGPQTRKEFDDFGDGEFLIAVETGAVGVRVPNNRIMWLTGTSIGKVTSDPVPNNKVYGEPTDVVITT